MTRPFGTGIYKPNLTTCSRQFTKYVLTVEPLRLAVLLTTASAVCFLDWMTSTVPGHSDVDALSINISTRRDCLHDSHVVAGRRS